jgi:sugar fermentation stimulation protein A
LELRGLVQGRLALRENRFRARVLLADEPVAAHVPNSGRLRELLVPDARVWLAPAARPGRRTAYDLALVEHAGRLVSVDARLPNALFGEALAADWQACGRVLQVQREAPLGSSRLDYCLTGTAGRCWVEVKSVTLVRDGVAMFPDAPTARGVRHVRELQAAVAAGEAAAVVFVVQRDDAHAFRPYAENDPAFATALTQAAAAGVQVRAYRCRVATTGVWLDSEIPVLLADGAPLTATRSTPCPP